VRPQARNIILGAPETYARRLSVHLGPDVIVTRNGLLRHHHLVLLYLDAKLPLVEGLCWRLHRPMNCSWQVRAHSLLTGIVPSCHIVHTDAALDSFPGGGPRGELI
jgi:hypothetical protein